MRRRHEAAAAARDDGVPDRTNEAADSLRWLVEQLTTLPEPYRSTLLARYVRDRSPAEIARESGEPVRTVKTRLARGLALLRERFAARGPEWRAAFVMGFGLRDVAVSGSGGAGAAVFAGAVVMSTTAKVVVGLVAAVVLLGALAVWAPWRDAGPIDAVAERAVVASAPAASEAPAIAVPNEREPAPVAAAPSPATGDAQSAIVDPIVVFVHDGDTGAPIVAYALRQHRGAKVDLIAKEAPLLHAGEHAGGRLVMPAAEFDQGNFVVEVQGGAYLPSRWFELSDAVERDGERVIDVALPLPVEVTVRVVIDATFAPAAGTHVELLRSWPGHGPVTLRTVAEPSAQIRAQGAEPPMVLQVTGGRALLLHTETSDTDGRVRLRVPVGEALALRLRGPGHQPRVVEPFAVERGATEERVVQVAAGASIEFRVFPPAAVARLHPPPLQNAQDLHVSPLMLARRATGIMLRGVATGELRPPAIGLSTMSEPLDAHGVVRIDGLPQGDWEPMLCFTLQDDPGNLTLLEGERFCCVTLPVVRGIASQELRIVDVDASTLLPGSLIATVGVRGGQVDVHAIAANGAPLPQVSPYMQRPDDAGRIRATLPPARYFATWLSPTVVGSKLPLGEFTIDSGATTEVTLVPDLLPVRVRVVEVDGVTAARGAVVLRHPWWLASADTNGDGFATIDQQLRGDHLTVSFHRRIGERPDQQPLFGPPIELGTLDVVERAEPTVLRLPRQ